MENGTSGHDVSESTAREHFAYGHVYLDQEDWNRAFEEFSQAAKASPHDSHVLISLGRSCCACGRAADAVAFLEKAAELSPGYADAHFHLGQAYLDTGQRDRAIDQLKEALNINPRYSAANTLISRLLQSRDPGPRDPDEAEMSKEKGARHANTHFHLGSALMEKNLLQEAILELKEAIRLRPSYPDFHNRLGELYHRRGLFNLAEEEFRQALKINPRYARAALNLAGALKEHAAGLALEARAMFQRTLDLEPKNPLALAGLEALGPAGNTVDAPA